MSKPHHVWQRSAAGAVAASIIAVAALFVAGNLSSSDKTPIATAPVTEQTVLSDAKWIPAAVTRAEQSQRLFVTAPGWQVNYVNEAAQDDTTIRFHNGDSSAELSARPLDLYDSFVRDRAASAVGQEPLQDITIAGATGVLFEYGDANGNPTGDFTSMAKRGDRMIEIRSQLPSRQAYLEMIASIKEVSVDEWLSAMPAWSVKPDARAAAVDNILRDVPLPAGLDLDALRRSDFVSDPYQLNARVFAKVSCAWTDQWLNSTNPAKKAEAKDALVKTANAPTLKEMYNDGDYPSGLDMVVSHIEKDDRKWLTKPVNGGIDGIDVNYQAVLSCY